MESCKRVRSLDCWLIGVAKEAALGHVTAASLAPAGIVVTVAVAGRSMTTAVREKALTEAPAVTVVSTYVTLTETGNLMTGVEWGERGPSGGRGLVVKQAGQAVGFGQIAVAVLYCCVSD